MHLRPARVRVVVEGDLAVAGDRFFPFALHAPGDRLAVDLEVRHLAVAVLLALGDGAVRVLDILLRDAMGERHRRHFHRHVGGVHLHRDLPVARFLRAGGERREGAKRQSSGGQREFAKVHSSLLWFGGKSSQYSVLRSLVASE